MEKKTVEKTLYHTSTKDDNPFKWKDIKNLLIGLEDDDEIIIVHVDAYYSEDNSYDAHWWLEVRRMVEESDEQYEKRLRREEREKKESNERKYQTYLKLKAEFEKGE
jgi:hypothetical protein